VVIAPRKDGRVRLCGDYRETVNANAEPVSYPLPRAEELFANLSGGKTFTVFDLSDAYLQQPVDDESSMLLTINTHRGLFRVLRLPFGVSTAPAIFQRKMESMLKPIPNTNPLLDDVITTGQSDEEHVERVEQILELFRANNVRLNRRKFQFMVPDVAYLGHRISQEGIQPLQEKLEAIQNAPNPENVTQLRAFLGLLSYYRRFVPHLATLLEPLHRLTDDNVPWAWTGVHSQAFEESKQHLTSSAVLVHYDLDKPVVLACDASQYGVGAVLSHIMDDNSEKPIAYASRTMSKTERKYAQIDKEALSIIFGVRKFHQYLAGRPFVIMTDHQPLLRLFAPHKRMPEIMSPRMLRWSLLLAGYNYTLQFRAGKHHANADALSRLPIPADVAEDNVPEPPEVLFVNQDEQLPVTAEQIAEWTTSDNTLKQVLEWVKNGWPITKKLEVCFEPYVRRKDALTCLRDCLLWGSRVIVPPPARPMLLQQLHESHMGMNAMKARARSIFWWPQMDSEIECVSQACETCQLKMRDQAHHRPLEWTAPKEPWSRIHIDHAGPIDGKTYLIVVDATTKWLEVFDVPSTGAQATIKKLRGLFATFGLPTELVSDNGTGFTSQEFREFLRSNGIRHTLTPPYHPSSNGQAERAVQTFKRALLKMPREARDLHIKRFLLDVHTVTHNTTKKSPAEMMFGRNLRTVLHLVKPEPQLVSGPFHPYKPGDELLVRNFGKGERWMRGSVHAAVGSRWLLVKRSDGMVCKRHIDQVRRNTELGTTSDHFEWPSVQTPTTTSEEPERSEPSNTPDAENSVALGTCESPQRNPPTADVVQQPVELRRSQRVRKPVVPFDL